MPERAKSPASACIAGALAAAALLVVNTTASVAAECLENPDQQHVAQHGHWHYYTDRTLNRRCWYFEPAEATATNTQTATPVTTANENSQQSFFSRFAPGLFSPWPQQQQQQQPQQTSIPDNAAESAQTISPRPAKPTRVVRRERPRTAPPPTTSGTATAEQHDPPKPPAVEKNENRDPPDNVAAREALFQDFLKWQMERNVFGRP